MALELVLAILVAAVFACYLVYRWQEAAVDGGMAPPPYQKPVEDAADTPTITTPKAAWPFPSGDKP